jgi:hypothetical protein
MASALYRVNQSMPRHLRLVLRVATVKRTVLYTGGDCEGYVVSGGGWSLGGLGCVALETGSTGNGIDENWMNRKRCRWWWVWVWVGMVVGVGGYGGGCGEGGGGGGGGRDAGRWVT